MGRRARDQSNDTAEENSDAPQDRTAAVVEMIPVAALGVVCATLAIIAAMSSSFALGVLVGIVGLALALFGGWQSSARRRATRELQDAHNEIGRLRSEQDALRAASEAVSIDTSTDTAAPVADLRGKPTENRATDAPSRISSDDARQAGFRRLGEEVAATPSPMQPENLLDESYLHVTLNGRVASARRHLRPLSLILLDAVNGVNFDDVEPPKNGEIDRLSLHAADPLTVQRIILETLRDADTVCRLDSGRFALILEDTPENGAIWTVERIRRRISEALTETTVWAGVACYPAHGFDGPEVFSQATKAISSARDWYQDRTEVADG